MSKKIRLHRGEDLVARIDTLKKSAHIASEAIVKLATSNDPLQLLASLKFEQVGRDPLDPSRSLNLIEQVNQTFTCLAAYKAVAELFNRHPEVQAFTLNLGNVGGWDIESTETNSVVAEVFASVNPTNNQKLANDLKRVRQAPHESKYVFFICPSVPPGQFQHKLATDGIIAWSLGAIN